LPAIAKTSSSANSARPHQVISPSNLEIASCGLHLLVVVLEEVAEELREICGSPRVFHRHAPALKHARDLGRCPPGCGSLLPVTE
jgi:hypothetical protein